MLNKKEEKIYLTIELVINKEIDKKQASEILEMTTRNINRLIKKYHEQGKDGFSHKNKGKIPHNKKISEKYMDNLVNDYIENFTDYNFIHYLEESNYNDKISYSSLYRTFKTNDICSPEAHKVTLKNHLKKMESLIKDDKATDEQILLYNEILEKEEIKRFRRSSKNFKHGEQVQMDGTFGIWFSDIETCLHLSVDKGTKKVTSGEFDYQETTKAYVNLLFETITTYGIPKLIKTDRRTCFDYKNKYDILGSNIQFYEICKDLRISLNSNSNPLHKPNVERENRTFKGRLKNELRHNNIKTIEEANRYLKEIFIPKMNEKFSCNINPDKNVMRENVYSDLELDMIFSKRHTRKIDNASSFKYKGINYIPVDIETGELVYLKKGTIVSFLLSRTNEKYCKYNDEFYYVTEIEIAKKETIKNTKTQAEINASKAHVPSSNHPWKNGH